MPKLINHTGQVFGRWTVLARHSTDQKRPAKWFCRCDCGKEGVVDGYALRTGGSTSCGCRHGEITRARIGSRHHNWKGGRRACKIRGAYGIEQKHYESMMAAQGGVCAICKNAETAKRQGVVRPLSVDHDHTNGRIRGLLCNRCNTAIGLMLDSASNLVAAAEYLNSATLAEVG